MEEFVSKMREFNSLYCKMFTKLAKICDEILTFSVNVDQS